MYKKELFVFNFNEYPGKNTSEDVNILVIFEYLESRLTLALLIITFRILGEEKS